MYVFIKHRLSEQKVSERNTYSFGRQCLCRLCSVCIAPQVGYHHHHHQLNTVRK